MRARVGQVLCLAAVAMLGACEAFQFEDDPTTEEEAYAALQAETLALREETDLLSVTDVTELPTVGTATYAGTALIALDPVGSGSASELIGSAEIVANFETSTLTGQADGFYGTVQGGDVAAFDGQVFLSEGRIDRTGADQIGANVNGTLQGGGDTLVVDGAVAGNFLGDPLLLNEAPAAIAVGSDDATTFRLNGADVTGGMEIIGTN